MRGRRTTAKSVASGIIFIVLAAGCAQPEPPQTDTVYDGEQLDCKIEPRHGPLVGTVEPVPRCKPKPDAPVAPKMRADTKASPGVAKESGDSVSSSDGEIKGSP